MKCQPGRVSAAIWMLLALLAVNMPARGQSTKAPSIFDVGKEKALRAVVTSDETLPEFASGAPDMALTLSGIIAELRTPKDIEALRATVPHNPMLGDAGNAQRICTIHLFAKATGKRVGIYRDAKAEFIAAELEGEQPQRVQLKRDAFAALYFAWPSYREGSFDDKASKDPVGTVFTLPKPFVAGQVTMDQKTLSDRFLAGGATDVEGADRVLEKEKFEVRLPRTYSARIPAGLLIWISPGDLRHAAGTILACA